MLATFLYSTLIKVQILRDVTSGIKSAKSLQSKAFVHCIEIKCTKYANNQLPINHENYGLPTC